MKKVTWIMLGFLSLVSIFSFWKYFDKVFPIINLSITMDRHEAKQKAFEFAKENQFLVQDYDTALQFKEDGMLQAFVELEGGGKEAFKEMITKRYHQPYEWSVRFYKPNTINELFVNFAPDGTLNGFLSKIPENQKGAALGKDQALKIALDKASEMHVDMECYCLVEHNMQEQPSGRIDHTFVYERNDIKLGKGLYRIKLKVFGDQFSGLERLVKIPDEFIRRYQQMFADNKLIASVAQNIAIFFYIFIIGLLLFLFFYRDSYYLLLKKHAFLTMIFFAITLLSSLNNWSFFWNFYPTNISPFLFGIKQLAVMFLISVIFSLFVGAVCILVDAADRYMFRKHIQFLKSWSSSAAGSYQIFQMTLVGYSGAAIFLGYQVVYAFWTQSMGWWSPLGQLFDPNILSTYLPFLTPIANAFKAGFWEEFVFRGLPLAGVAFLTRDSKSKKWWFLLILVAQAIIFGALHANYPQQPAYNRIVEIFAPSIMFALFYYVFGLLPGIITHFVYDAVLMCIPIWASDLLIHKICAAVFISIPLLFVLVYWWLQGRKFKQAPLDVYNDAMQYNEIMESEDFFQKPVRCHIEFKHVAYITLCTVIGFIFTYFSNQWNFFNYSCQITRDTAFKVAQESVKQYGFDKNEEWTLVAEFVSENESLENKFIWQKYGGLVYQDLQKDYIPAHYWKVLWKKFTGSVEDRSENFEVCVSVDGTVLSISHVIPEFQKGADLDENQARKVALELIENIYDIHQDQVVLISCQSIKHENRRDYTIMYKQTDRYPFEDDLGQAKIMVKLSGDQLCKIKKNIHVPEVWQRSEQNRASLDLMFYVIVYALYVMILLLACFISIRKIKLTSRFLTPILFFTIIYFVIKIFSLLNGWDQILFHLSTAEPFINQVISIVSSYALYFVAVGFVSLFAVAIFIFDGTKSLCSRYISWMVLLILVGMSWYSFSSWFKQFAVMHEALDYEYQFIKFKFPVYGMLVAYFLQAVLVGSLQYMSFSIVAQYLHDKGKAYLQWPFFILVGILLSDVVSFSSIPLWISSGIVIGIVYYLLNKYIISNDIKAAFLISFGASIMKMLPSVWCLVYPGIAMQFFLSLIIFSVFITYVYRRI
ncbi:CPBP family intramembrane metalloprotease [Candidatus Dependentiae bacterium]|nr:CPBP family intramembrane metalloprotease [Candidatus Dependentiae bacterium]